jgi:hypothetical protein
MSRETQAGVKCHLPLFSSTLNAAIAPCCTSPYSTGALKAECCGPQKGVSTQRTPVEFCQLADLQLLGWVLRDGSSADVIRRLRWPKRIGFLLAATCGFLLFSSKAEEYFYNPFFRIKILLFMLVAVHALVFRKSVYRDADLDLNPEPPARAKIAAGFSLFLWLSILCAGRYIGYVEGRSGMHFK